MSIAILPARLANQIAAGEVVERPASVVKELVENSIDAGATRIQIEIEKGGAKRIRITDNGCGIAKDELTLALSRHATSKIHSLDDLEAISSLGFRGEALASISSVARLTLTSKPEQQENAWQACAEGRDMTVTVQPAAHPDGTTIDVSDLFFNTPARRKFLRTEKTEFSHIEEVIRRIALANFHISFVLIHNQKTVKNYRAIQNKDNYIKRIAAVCGQSFVDNAIAVDCQHDDIHLWGWIAKPHYTRKQNDLCYSYVNERMMRDKLINHAIRQAYGEFIDNDVYPAFVLFLNVDYKEVDVNVHPAKHEVRFHQGRYVHDFIYSVCHKALVSDCQLLAEPESISAELQHARAYQEERDYVKPLQHVAENSVSGYQASAYQTESSATSKSYASPSSSSSNDSSSSYQPYSRSQAGSIINIAQAAENYQQLMTAKPAQTDSQANIESNSDEAKIKLLSVHQEQYLLYLHQDELKICQAEVLVKCALMERIQAAWQNGLVSQPLLLPIKVKLSPEQVAMINTWQFLLQQSGIHINVDHGYALVRQFPALLRKKDVATAIDQIVQLLADLPNAEQDYLPPWQAGLALIALPEKYDLAILQRYYQELLMFDSSALLTLLELNSTQVDLTSSLKQLLSLADNDLD